MKNFLAKCEPYLVYLMLLIGILSFSLYLIIRLWYSKFYDEHNSIIENLTSLSKVIFGAGVFAAVLKWIQFKGFFKTAVSEAIKDSEFKKSLQSAVNTMVYSTEYISNQENKHEIWSNATFCLFNSRFPEIANEIGSEAENVFFEAKRLSHYYENWIIEVSASLDENGVLSISEKATRRVVSSNLLKNQLDLDFVYTTKKGDDISWMETKVNGNPIQINVTESETAHIKKYAGEITLDGKRNDVYHHLILKQVYANDQGYYFICDRVFKGIHVIVSCPGLSHFFAPFDTDDWNKQILNSAAMYHRNGLHLPGKGFSIHFYK